MATFSPSWRPGGGGGAGPRSMPRGRRPLPSRWHRSSNGRWSARSRRWGPWRQTSPRRSAPRGPGPAPGRLRRSDLEIGLKEAEANLDEKRALFVRAEQDHQRFQALFTEGAISAAELDRVGAGARAAKAQKESAEEALRRVADQLRRTTVVAPFSGYLVKKHAEVGQWIEEGGEVADLVGIDIVYGVVP